jgi:hypothetical protein
MLTTLSPFRGFKEWLTEKGWSDLSENHEDLPALALRRALDRVDGVQKFHLSNGAILAGFRPHSNAPDTEDARSGLNIGVNYVYPLDAKLMSDNAAAYKKEGTIALADYLFDALEPSEQRNAFSISASTATRRKPQSESKPVQPQSGLQPGL